MFPFDVNEFFSVKKKKNKKIKCSITRKYKKHKI